MHVPSSLGMRLVNGSLLLLAVSLVVIGACSPAMPAVDRSTLWMDTVKHGDMVREVRGAGRLDRTDAGDWSAVLRVPETQTFDLEVGQPARVDLRVASVDGRVTELGDVIASGTLDVFVEITGELPDNTRAGLSVDATIEIETLTDVRRQARLWPERRDGDSLQGPVRRRQPHRSCARAGSVRPLFGEPDRRR